ncbi:MAG: outer membrane lipoprotein chaperone LolA [Gammaproteobacteria bacterium]|nr:outer membrane lipoprotein chaperone LolA [Gammaproteobacteria bacterium]
MSKAIMMCRIVKMIACLLVAILPSVSVSAEEAKDKLDRFVLDLASMRAGFVQTVIDANGTIVDESEGTMSMLRPGRFRWDYTLPYEQHIITNGKRLWIYEPDLDQVTIKPYEAGVGETPALLLSGDSSVFERFTVSELEITDSDYEWLLLKPLDQESGYESIQMGFDENGFKVVRFSDDFGHHTQLEFIDIEANVTLAEDEFEFQEPEGIEIISDPGQF